MSTFSLSAEDAHASSRLYRAVWRWHFYAGLFVVPFLLMLAFTGTFMMLYSQFGNELGWEKNVTVTGEASTPSSQATLAVAAVPGGKLATYIAPESPERPSFFEVNKDGTFFAVAVDPYAAVVLDAHDESTTYRALAERIHGTLLLGTWGDRLIEIAASLSIIMVVTGLYMWWPRGTSFASALLPNFALKGRALWRELHLTTGIWMSVFLVLFMLTGLSWAGIWGEKFVQPWSSFPANKWDNVPTSDQTHASMNHNSSHEVPWAIEQTPMPASGSKVGVVGVQSPVTLDSVVQWAAVNGFKGQYKVNVPSNDKGVFTVSYDGRNEDGVTPSGDRFVHIDQYTGKILADVGYADYKTVGKLMAWGIGLHKGMAGVWNLIFNLAYMSLVVFACISGVVMWWKRRPAGEVAAPLYPRDFKVPAGVLLVGAVLGVAFPLGGLAIVVFAGIDFMLPKRLKEAASR
jgi:uncharacterized iron-regulated membrane protein